MKARLLLSLLPLLPVAALAAAANAQDYTESFDTIYNSLTVQRAGTIVELRARSRAGVFRESAVDLADPLTQQVPYTKTLYAGLFFQPKPKKVLMVGLGGAGFHRLFTVAFPDTTLQTVELDPKVVELTKDRLYFKPTDKTPIATQDGRIYIKRSAEKWDWIILDAYRGGYVPPHLKTKEFYQECAAKLADDGVLLTNLHATTALFYADLKTLTDVFPQIVLFRNSENPGNVIACAVKYRSPVVTDPAQWPAPGPLNAPLQGRVDLARVMGERMAWPTEEIARYNAKVITDDFGSPELLDAIQIGNTKEK
jgi:spermidine synthase